MNKIDILPVPQHMEIHEGVYGLKDVVYVFGAQSKVLAYLQTFLHAVEAKDELSADIVFKINPLLTNYDEYRLNIEENGMQVEAAGEQGAFYACCTLKQLVHIGGKKLPALEIEDYADFEVRGLMYDISRGKLPKMETIKETIDLIADLKYNHFELYVESFVYENPQFAQYSKGAMPLTVKEIKELEQYAKNRFVELVPNQNGLGHMSSWTAMEEIKPMAITVDGKPTDTLNPLHPGTLPLMDKIYSGVLDYFESGYANIGLDEPYGLGLGETREACEQRGRGAVYTEYLNKICALVKNKYHKTPMYWDDVVFSHPECIPDVPKDAIAMVWGYEREHRFEQRCRTLKEIGLDFIVCPGTSSWVSVTGRSQNMVCNIYNACECAKRYGAKGILLTDWGDGNAQSVQVGFLGYALGSALSWNFGNPEEPDMIAARNRHLDRAVKYTDEYIFKVKNEKSVADLLFRMGNYYLLE